MQSEVSAVVVNYNGSRFLGDALTPLFGQTVGDVEVVLVDNASTDASLKLVEDRFQDQVQRGLLKVVRSDINLGFAKGANLGLRSAIGKYVACLNSDAFVSSDYFEKMIGALESLHNAVAVGCILDTMGSYTRYASTFFRKGCIRSPESAEIILRPVYCLAPCGAAALYDREVFLDVGGYDEGFVSDWEDHDLGYRLNVLGFRCIHNPDVTVRHVGAGSFGGVDFNRLKRIARNMLLTYYKNCESFKLWKILADVSVSQIDSRRNEAEKYLSKEIFHPLRKGVAAIGGLCNFFRVASSYGDTRSRLQRSRRTSDREILHLTSGEIEW